MLSLFILFVQTFAYYQPKFGFLQKDASTSLGKLAGGIEDLNYDFSDFSKNLDQALSDIDKELDASIMITAQVGVSLIDKEISELLLDLDDVNQEINEIELIIAVMTQECEKLSNCENCIDNESCVWCNAKNICTAGDQAGPVDEECEDFSYKQCSVCASLNDCSSCLNNNECG